MVPFFYLLFVSFVFFFIFSVGIKILPFWRSITVRSQTVIANRSIYFGHSIHNRLPFYIRTNSISLESDCAVFVCPTSLHWHLFVVFLCTLWICIDCDFGNVKKGSFTRTVRIASRTMTLKTSHNCLACTQARTNLNQSPFTRRNNAMHSNDAIKYNTIRCGKDGNIRKYLWWLCLKRKQKHK